MSGCRGGRDAWSVTSDIDRLKPKPLSHGHACHCGAMVIAWLDCELGHRHKHTITRARFAKLRRVR